MQFEDLTTRLISQGVVSETVYAVPREDWPVWARALKRLAKPEDKGIGDVVERLIGHETSIAFKVWFKTTFGKPCGCNGRQALWNKLYPLPIVK